MNERIEELAKRADVLEYKTYYDPTFSQYIHNEEGVKKFAELIIQSCIDKIETYRIPVGNSSSGELACEWTYAALKEIRDDIKEHFGLDKPPVD
jgi:hypothetical protein